jgi:HSP20 family protein
MLTRFDDLDRTFAVMDQLRRRFYEDFEPRRRDTLRDSLGDEGERAWSGRFPRISFVDTGASLVLEADLPGLTEKDVQLTIHQDVLSMSGERRSDAPQGYVAHRQERAPVKFARSFTLPCKVDPERSTAVIKNGVLTLTLPKAVEAQPRQIAVKAQ